MVVLRFFDNRALTFWIDDYLETWYKHLNFEHETYFQILSSFDMIFVPLTGTEALSRDHTPWHWLFCSPGSSFLIVWESSPSSRWLSCLYHLLCFVHAWLRLRATSHEEQRPTAIKFVSFPSRPFTVMWGVTNSIIKT